MTFKRKVFGGADTDDVLDHFSSITLQYEAVISSYLARTEAYTQQITALQSKLARIERQNEEWKQYYRDLIQWYESANACLKAQNSQLLQQNMALWAEMDQRRWA